MRSVALFVAALSALVALAASDPQESAAERPYGSKSRELQEEQRQNRYKPEFTNCKSYKPEVPEESDRGE